MSAERDLIRAFVARWGPLAGGIGDDAAVLDVPHGEKLIVSTDASVESIHFRRGNISPSEIGYRAAAAALSDLAAMAARPIGLLFALNLPVSWRGDAEDIAGGVGDAARSSNCPVVGGNISSGEELSITTTVLGAALSPLLRSGANAGDSVYVTGSLGAAALAASEWGRGREPAANARLRFVRPSPRIGEAIWLAAHGATSAIDISDGLATDALHLAESSAVRIEIDADLVPLFEAASSEQGLSGGEDYELLLTAPSLNVEEFRRTFDLPLTRIGSVAKGAVGLTFRGNGSAIAVPPGFDHLEQK